MISSKVKCKYFSICLLRKFEKNHQIDNTWRKQYCQGLFTKCRRYLDSKQKISHPDNMLPDGSIISKYGKLLL